MKQLLNPAQLPYSGKIHFNTINRPSKIKQRPKLREWLLNVVIQEGYLLGELSINFCSDDHLLEINKTHLNHNYYTDIITFNLNEAGLICGDLYISIDRVADNATQHKTEYHTELNRVMVHGVLHLCGWNDKTKKQQAEIRKREDYYLSLLKV